MEEEERMTIEELAERFTLPVLARISCAERVESDAELDLEQLLLLYKAYRTVKVQAKLLYRKKHGQGSDQFLVYGSSTLVIPKGYSGLFALVDDNGRSTARRFMLINDVMKAAGRIASSFLVHNCNVQALRRLSDRHYRRTLVSSGTVLRAVGLFTDQLHCNDSIFTSKTVGLRKSLERLFSGKNQHARPSSLYSPGYGYGYGYGSCGSGSADSVSAASPEDLTQRSYLKCLGNLGEELYLPLTTAGSFYLISESGRSKEYNRQCLHQMSTLLDLQIRRTKPWPCRVKLVFGLLPELRQPFTGYLQLEEPTTANVVLACTTRAPPYHLFEMDLASQFELDVIPASKQQQLLLHSEANSRFRAALAFAKAQSDSWRRQIHLAHQVTVDAQEEEHIYQEILPRTEEKPREEQVAPPLPQRSALYGSVLKTPSKDSLFSITSTNASVKQDKGMEELRWKDEDLDSDVASEDTLTYRLSVLSHPSRISFA